MAVLCVPSHDFQESELERTAQTYCSFVAEAEGEEKRARKINLPHQMVFDLLAKKLALEPRPQRLQIGSIGLSCCGRALLVTLQGSLDSSTNR